MINPKLIENTASILIFLFPPLLMTTPDGGAIVLLLLLLTSSIGLLLNRTNLSLSFDENLLLAAIGFYLLIFGFNLWWFNTSISELDNVTRFLLLLPVFFYLRKSNLNLRLVFYGLAAGALACFIFAVYQRYYLNLLRVKGNMDWVHFGGISITIGLMCATVSLLTEDKRLKIIMQCGFVLGVWASLLSGTRGAWLSILTALALLIFINPKGWTVKARIVTCLSSLIVIIMFYAIPDVQGRVDLAISDVTAFFVDGNPATNIGIRLETWHASAIKISEYPFTGVGEGNFEKQMQLLIDQNRINPVVAHISHVHNEFISAMFHRGILGLIAAVILFLIPFFTFLKNFNSTQSNQKVLLGSGLIMIGSIITMSMSDIIFGHHKTTLFYATYVFIIYGSACRPAANRQI